MVNFIRRINRKRKKLGLENAKYIYIIAFEEYTRPHFHLLISGGIDRDELERMWGKCDRPNTRNISPDENFLLTGLATYITQNPHGTKRWCPSKNLKNRMNQNAVTQNSEKQKWRKWPLIVACYKQKWKRHIRALRSWMQR